MKNFALKAQYYIIILWAMVAGGCEIAGLELQTDEEYQYHVLDPKIDMTALEFLYTPRQDSLFTLMIDGIEYAGLEDEYAQPDRTFLFLTNDAILRYINDSTVSADSYFGYKLVNGAPATRWEDYPVEEVRDFFRYHIVEGTYSHDNLGIDNTEATTLLDSPDNKVYMKILNARFSGLRINDRPLTKRFIEARTSNIQPTNGVIHVFDGFIEPGTL